MNFTCALEYHNCLHTYIHTCMHTNAHRDSRIHICIHTFLDTYTHRLTEIVAFTSPAMPISSNSWSPYTRTFLFASTSLILRSFHRPASSRGSNQNVALCMCVGICVYTCCVSDLAWPQPFVYVYVYVYVCALMYVWIVTFSTGVWVTLVHKYTKRDTTTYRSHIPYTCAKRTVHIWYTRIRDI